jgi:HSP20 family protein
MSPALQPSVTRGSMLFSPACDVEEHPDSYLLSFDLPGMKKDDISIEVRGNQIVVSGDRRQECKVEEGCMQLLERRAGHFSRTMSLPTDIKSDHIEARYEDGVLSVAVPKSEATRATKVKIGESKSGFFKNLLSGSSKQESVDVNVSKSEAVSAKGSSCS